MKDGKNDDPNNVNSPFHAIYEEIKKEKEALNPFKGKKVRETKFTKIAKSILGGSLKAVKNEVILSWKTINRQYKDQYLGYYLLHFATQEGYTSMIDIIFDPKAHR